LRHRIESNLSTACLGDFELNKLEGDRDHFVEDPSHTKGEQSHSVDIVI